MIAESQTPIQESMSSSEIASGRSPRSSHPVLSRTGPVVIPQTWYTVCKRIVDVVISLILLVLFSPFILLAILMVKLTSKGPAFYTQIRVGLGGKPFRIWKLRSMYHNCEKISGAMWSRTGDPRVTPIGRFLRRSHIDELPQLWNILKGEMSLIGPRPERPEFVPQLEQAIPRYRERLLVLPGVTGLAQIHLGPDTDLASVERKLAFDLYYIKTLGFWNDLKILLATSIHVFWPYLPSKWFFSLDAKSCADAVGTRIRESGS